MRKCEAIAAEVTGQQDRADERGRRNRIEHGAGDGDDPEGPRQRFARTIADPVHGFRDDRPRHQLDGAFEQQEHDDEAAENAAGQERGFRDRCGPGNRRHGFLRGIGNA
jgi:hypothetical protein